MTVNEVKLCKIYAQSPFSICCIQNCIKLASWLDFTVIFSFLQLMLPPLPNGGPAFVPTANFFHFRQFFFTTSALNFFHRTMSMGLFEKRAAIYPFSKLLHCKIFVQISSNI